MIAQSICWHGWSVQPSVRNPGSLQPRGVQIEAHGRLNRFNEFRTPWLHVANPAIRGRQSVDYGLHTGIDPLNVNPGFLGILQREITADEGFRKEIQGELDRVLRHNDIEYVRNSHSAYVRQSLGQELRSLTDRAWGGLRSQVERAQMNRVRAPLEHLKKEIEGTDAWKKASPVLAPMGGAAIAAYILYSGQPVNWSLPGGFTFGTQQNLQAAVGRFSLGTPWFSADVNFSVHAPDTRDPSQPAPGDAIQASEKVQVAIGHTIPVLGVNTSFSYATTTGTISAALSRNLLVPNLTGSVSTTRSVRPTQGGNYGEETINLSYGMNF